MLSLTKGGKKIAFINNNSDKCIYLKDDNDDEPEVETSPENKLQILKSFLDMDKKLGKVEYDNLVDAFKKNNSSSLNDKLQRKYDEGIKYIETSLKRHLNFGKSVELFPIIEEPSYRIFVSGLSGSGKSTWIAQFLKHNKPKSKEALILLFSPVDDDEAFKKLKNMVHIDLDEFESEVEREMSIDDIPEGSVCIFDDTESYKKDKKKKYLELRNIIAERGRHKNISLINVSHNPMNGNETKIQLRESQYYLIFPRFNSRDVKLMLKTYAGFDKKEIDEIMALNTRWALVRKTIPRYTIAQHNCICY